MSRGSGRTCQYLTSHRRKPAQPGIAPAICPQPLARFATPFPRSGCGGAGRPHQAPGNRCGSEHPGFRTGAARRRQSASQRVQGPLQGCPIGPEAGELRLQLPDRRLYETPAARDRVGRNAAGSAASGMLTTVPSRSLPSGASATLAATDPAPTTASSSELLARRLAPCSPVPATSPHAHRPGSVLRPCQSTAMPPIW